jgi:exodeoxyribonuclease V alpha subunit
MKSEEFDRLHNSDLFTELDLQFAGFISRLSGAESPQIFLAAALASRSRREGHICVDLSALAGKPLADGDPIGLNCPEWAPWKKALESSPAVGQPGDYRPLILDGTHLYLYRYWNYEKRLAELLKARGCGGGAEVDELLLKDGLSRLFPGDNKKETDWQKVASFASVVKNFCVISGGPGTGKTFAVAKILALLLEQSRNGSLRIALAAPTGKAAARLKEAIQKAKEKLACSEEIKAAIPEEASTIHRLLRSIPGSPYFQHNEKNPLPADVVVVDEASMVDLALLSKLAAAVPTSSRLILLGDKDQLASVEAGAVLGDICDTGHIHSFSPPFRRDLKAIAGEEVGGSPNGDDEPGMQDCIVQLKKSYRFGEGSGIGAASQAVNDGDSGRALGILKSTGYKDIQWQELPRPDGLYRLMKERIITGFSSYLKTTVPDEVFDLFSRFRILCALREGPFGVYALNLLAEQVLRKEGLIQQEGRWYFGRPVMITRNDYNLKLFNGDVGIILPDSESSHEPRAYFPSEEGTIRKFPPLRLPEHETVYAVTVHKSQGSEFNRVLLLLPDADTPVLTRELIYTGITRAREKVEVWSKEEVFRAAVSRRIERTSGLRKALWTEAKNKKGRLE